MTSPNSLNPLFALVDANSAVYIDKLSQAVSIPSVSGDHSMRKHVFAMADWLAREMSSLGISVSRREQGLQPCLSTNSDVASLQLPPILLGTFPATPVATKPTVLVYGHYDVQPALQGDGWLSDPWTLSVTSDGKMVARGSSDDKGPLLGWLWVIDVFAKAGVDLPVNLLFCFEGMEESGSEGLDDLIFHEAKSYFRHADCVCISDNYWLGTTRPCLTYGLRGICYFDVCVQGPSFDLHSGVFGGTIHEPMTDLVQLMSGLVKTDGTILVPGLTEEVDPVTESEKTAYEKIDFSAAEMARSFNGELHHVLHKEKVKLLMHRWRYPTLSLHGIEGAFSAPGCKTVIPAKVSGKFSVRIVPSMKAETVHKAVKSHLETVFKKLGSPNKMTVTDHHSGKPWVADINHWNFDAARRATKTVYGVDPDFTREGGSIPVALSFQDALNKCVLLLPMGRADDGAHSVNEKLDKSNYINGIKLMIAYLSEVSTSHKVKT